MELGAVAPADQGMAVECHGKARRYAQVVVVVLGLEVSEGPDIFDHAARQHSLSRAVRCSHAR